MKRPITKTGAPLGVAPTQAQKLQYIANKLGLPGIGGMQGSTVNIVDTVMLTANASARQTLSFFTQTQNKSRNFSNFQNGTLSAGEAMVLEQVSFFLLSLSSADLTSNANDIIGMMALGKLDYTTVTQRDALKLGLMNITIANQRVVKDYLCFESDPNYNPKTTGIASANYATGATLVATAAECSFGQNTITLESPPVLPPNQKLELSYEVPPVGTFGASNLALMCVVGRFGSIFASKTTL